MKRIPDFKDEQEEADFWSTHDATEYVDLSKAQYVVFPNLKYSTVSISLRLPKWLLERVKAMANERDVPYQSLIKTFLYDRVKEELAPPQANRKDSEAKP